MPLANAYISRTVLRERLGLPEGYEVIAVKDARDWNGFHVLLSSADLPEHTESQTFPQVGIDYGYKIDPACGHHTGVTYVSIPQRYDVETQTMSAGEVREYESSLFAVPQVNTVAGNNEWYTPARYIEAAREVMGSIDLDPASCETANQTVKAGRFYTQQEDGLSQSWYGRVWLNPPFTAEEGAKLPQFTWGLKLLNEYGQGHTTQAILLLATSYRKWFHRLWEMTDAPVCLSEERIHFYRPDRTSQELREPMSFLYLGTHEQSFIDVFGMFGTVVRRVSQPKARPATLALWSQEGVTG